MNQQKKRTSGLARIQRLAARRLRSIRNRLTTRRREAQAATTDAAAEREDRSRAYWAHQRAYENREKIRRQQVATRREAAASGLISRQPRPTRKRKRRPSIDPAPARLTLAQALEAFAGAWFWPLDLIRRTGVTGREVRRFLRTRNGLARRLQIAPNGAAVYQWRVSP